VTRTFGKWGRSQRELRHGDGTALAGTDYTTTTGNADMGGRNMDAKGNCRADPRAGRDSTNRSFTMSLSGLSGATMGVPPTETVTVLGDPGFLRFQYGEMTAGSVCGQQHDRDRPRAWTASITRRSVGLHDRGRHCLADTDYNATNGTLTWADGDTADKKIIVRIPARNVVTVRNFTLELSNPVGAFMGEPDKLDHHCRKCGQHAVLHALDQCAANRGGP
jgi:hypothetical protein